MKDDDDDHDIEDDDDLFSSFIHVPSLWLKKC